MLRWRLGSKAGPKKKVGGAPCLYTLSIIPVLALIGIISDGWPPADSVGEPGPAYIAMAVNHTGNGVAVPTDRSYPTVFAKTIRIDETAMDRAGEASYGLGKIELAMSLDVTGSMKGRKIEDLKAAAKSVADILLADNTESGRARIALAPYSAAVNAGDYAKRVSDFASRDGCVFERSGAHAYDDFPPLAGTFLGAMAASGQPTNGHYSCPSAPVLPMTDNLSLIKDTINSYGTSGRRAGHLGIAWSWYLLSPDWAGVWPAKSQPASYGETGTIKAVILTSDGAFNTSYQNGAQNRTSARQAQTICTNMKDHGVVVYVVAFKAPDQGRSTLKDCATSQAHYFEAETGEQLKQAFRKAAASLLLLRLPN